MSLLVSRYSRINPDQVPNHGVKDPNRRPRCAGADCTDVLISHSPGGRGQRELVVLTAPDGRRSIYHDGCKPGQTICQSVMGGVSATLQGVGQAMANHPVITSIGVLAIAGLATYGVWSAVPMVERCFESLTNRDISYCATMPREADPSQFEYMPFDRVSDWIPTMDEAVPQAYEAVKGGAAFINVHYTQYFAKPFSEFVSRFLPQA